MASWASSDPVYTHGRSFLQQAQTNNTQVSNRGRGDKGGLGGMGRESPARGQEGRTCFLVSIVVGHVFQFASRRSHIIIIVRGNRHPLHLFFFFRSQRRPAMHTTKPHLHHLHTHHSQWGIGKEVTAACIAFSF